jgi:hypothetical protein
MTETRRRLRRVRPYFISGGQIARAVAKNGPPGLDAPSAAAFGQGAGGCDEQPGGAA